MNDTVTNGFMLGFNLVLACILVSLGILLLTSGKSMATSFSAKVSAITTNIEDDGLMQYDGSTVKGSDVVMCIKKYTPDIEVEINKFCGSTEATATTYKWTTKSLNGAKFNNLPSYAYDDMTGNPLADGQLYINPNADYKGSIEKNANGVITKIVFNQTKYRQDAYEVPDAGNTTVVINNSNSDANASLNTAIAELTTASTTLNSAIQNLQNAGVGANTVQEETKAIVDKMYNEVLPGISTRIDDLNSNLGGDANQTMANDIASMKGDLASIYETLKNLNVNGGNNSVDDVYNEVSNSNKQLTTLVSDVNGISTKMDSLVTKMDSLQKSIDTMASKMDADHKTIITLLQQIQSTQNQMKNTQALQSTKLDDLTSQVKQIDQAQQNLQSKVNNQEGRLSQQSSHLAQHDSDIAYLRSMLNTRNADVTTYGDLQDYSKKDATYTQQISDLQTQCQNAGYAMKAVSSNMKTFSEWLQKHPGGKVS